jgi:hypothetical protein
VLPEDLKDGFDLVRSHRATIKDLTLEVFKARQDFYQHLMLLNAGTLSLLLTVVLALAATDHLSAVHVHDAQPFLRGCGMLVASILLSLVHNHLNVSFFIHQSGSNLTLYAGLDIQTLYTKLRQAEVDAGSLEEGPANLEANAVRYGKLATRVENLNRLIGPLAQLLTWIAYFEFFSSMRAIILSVAK